MKKPEIEFVKGKPKAVMEEYSKAEKGAKRTAIHKGKQTPPMKKAMKKC